MNENLVQFREHYRAMSQLMHDSQDSERVRQIALNLARTADLAGMFGLGVLAQKIPGERPGPLTRPHRSGDPLVPKNHETVEALVAFQRRFESVLVELEAFQARAAANESLPRDEKREIVLEAILALDHAKNQDGIWAYEAQWRSELTLVHVSDAIEYWLSHDMLRPALAHDGYEEALQYFKMTANGRSRAEDGAPKPQTHGSQTIFQGDVNMYAHGSGIAQTIGSHIAVELSQTAISEVSHSVQTIREHLSEFPEDDRSDVAEHLDTIEQEQKTANPRPNKIKAAFNAILSVTKAAGDAVSPVVEAAARGGVAALMKGTGG